MRMCVFIVWALVAAAALGQDAKPQAAGDAKPQAAYGPVGAPLNAKVDARWNRYHNYAEVTAILKQLAEAHPQKLKLTSLGTSYGGREMWLVTVTDFEHGEAAMKPAFWIDGGIHANEIQGPEAVLYTAWFLCEMAGQNELVDRLLKQRVFYMLPMMSPDSRDVHMHEPATTHSPRGGMRPYDNDRDGLEDEDGPDDLDGDGHLTMMRIADANGTFKPHAKYPQLLVRAEPDEEVPQRYRLLGLEGIDNDGDGRVNEDAAGGYDPNRDWPWFWQPEYVQNGALKYPLWIDENRMVAQFIIDHPNIAGAQSYHNTGGMILRGPGVKGEQLARGDLAVFTAIGKRGELMLPGYRYMHLAEDLYPAYGSEIDWLYGMRGVTAYTNEMFTAFNYFRETGEEEDGFFGTEESQFAFEKYLLLGEGLVEWHEVEHPIYGTIEVGGTKKNWLRQPPSFLLEEELHRNMAFTLYHADQLPLVSVQSVTAKQVDGLWQVDAVIANDRLQPTRLGVDIEHRITIPDRVEISGKDLKVIAGLTSNEPFFLRPEEQEHHPRQMQIESIGGHGVVYVRWLVSGKPPFEVSVRSIKGGSDRMAVMGGM